ncbi:hypothetical protein PISMIDRAFT_688756 [Pisolithus microcarpus 441]|uniref:Uncharacterized protein n=1 Tax=Pisolithus microcarpus 441 TaxID=765257 RepID=A0A0C9Y8M0_9AGAM|nr:hypothetical protein PISMIDRAFT_688756 [Pisolithus microcarpus 441]
MALHCVLDMQEAWFTSTSNTWKCLFDDNPFLSYCWVSTSPNSLCWSRGQYIPRSVVGTIQSFSLRGTTCGLPT